MPAGTDGPTSLPGTGVKPAGGCGRSSPTGRPRFSSEERPKFKKAAGCLGPGGAEANAAADVAREATSITRLPGAFPAASNPAWAAPCVSGPSARCTDRGPVLWALARVPQSPESKYGPCPRVGGSGRRNAQVPRPIPIAGGVEDSGEPGAESPRLRPGGAALPDSLDACRDMRGWSRCGRECVVLAAAGEREGRCGVRRDEGSSLCPPWVPQRAGPRCACSRGRAGSGPVPGPSRGVEERGCDSAPTPESGRKSLSFQQRLMHQTSIFRTIELVIFFLLN